ncbi:MAG: lactate utilization protein [Verrucomicrobiota bacterium]
MNARETIFGRIREALSRPAQKPGGHDHASPPPGEARTAADCLPFGGADAAEQLTLFTQNAKELSADFRVVETPEALHAQLAELAQREGWKRVASHAGELTEAACAALSLPVTRTDGDGGYDVGELEACDAGITACEALVAQTGSVLVTSRSCGGRALSVLPPHHVVLARRNQLVPDLTAAFALLETRYAPSYPSMISFISGPSRTGDIERILVLGAHGPKKLTIFCL